MFPPETRHPSDPSVSNAPRFPSVPSDQKRPQVSQMLQATESEHKCVYPSDLSDPGVPSDPRAPSVPSDPKGQRCPKCAKRFKLAHRLEFCFQVRAGMRGTCSRTETQHYMHTEDVCKQHTRPQLRKEPPSEDFCHMSSCIKARVALSKVAEEALTPSEL